MVGGDLKTADKYYSVMIGEQLLVGCKTDIQSYVEMQKANRCNLTLHRVKLIAEAETTLEHRKWNYTNMWGFVYPVESDVAVIKQIVIYDNGKYIRMIKGSFVNLKENGRDISMIWGNKIFKFYKNKCSQRITETFLCVAEEFYENKSDALNDMNKPEKIDLASIFDEIFYDG